MISASTTSPHHVNFATRIYLNIFKGVAVLQLPSSPNQTLLIRGGISRPPMVHLLELSNAGAPADLKTFGLASQCHHHDPHLVLGAQHMQDSAARGVSEVRSLLDARSGLTLPSEFRMFEHPRWPADSPAA